MGPDSWVTDRSPNSSPLAGGVKHLWVMFASEARFFVFLLWNASPLHGKG